MKPSKEQRRRLHRVTALVRHETRVAEEIVEVDPDQIPAARIDALTVALTDYLAALRQLNHLAAVCAPTNPKGRS